MTHDEGDVLMRLTLRPNEKLYLNGAVVRVDRRTTIELLNDAVFLLESHILQVEDADTPLKQLYFAAQIMLIDPVNADQARGVFWDQYDRLLQVVTDPVILSGLHDCMQAVRKKRIFDVLKIIRGLFARETEILQKSPPVDGSGENAPGKHMSGEQVSGESARGQEVHCITNATKGGCVYDNNIAAAKQL